MKSRASYDWQTHNLCRRMSFSKIRFLDGKWLLPHKKSISINHISQLSSVTDTASLLWEELISTEDNLLFLFPKLVSPFTHQVTYLSFLSTLTNHEPGGIVGEAQPPLQMWFCFSYCGQIFFITFSEHGQLGPFWSWALLSCHYAGKKKVFVMAQLFAELF